MPAGAIDSDAESYKSARREHLHPPSAFVVAMHAGGDAFCALVPLERTASHALITVIICVMHVAASATGTSSWTTTPRLNSAMQSPRTESRPAARAAGDPLSASAQPPADAGSLGHEGGGDKAAAVESVNGPPAHELHTEGGPEEVGSSPQARVPQNLAHADSTRSATLGLD